MSDLDTMSIGFSPDVPPVRPELGALLQVWRAKSEAAGGLPARGDFDPLTLKPWLQELFIVEFERSSGRYKYRLVGTGLVQAHKRDSTGKYLDQLYQPEHLKPLCAGYDWVREHGRPNRLTGTLFFVGRDHVEMEALLLPVAMPADRDPQIIGAIYFSN